MATIIPCNAANITRACKRLSEGSLVAFPTETVYGLGANALNADAVLKIFHFKGRPATDPLIVHVPSLHSARALINVTAAEELVLQCMAEAFWPGPLTCVVRASHAVPSAVTSGSGYVGIRVPSHPTALALLRECGMPIAAPSANRFGHVSPTSPHHVVDDFAFVPEEVLVLDAPPVADVSCIGLESTVFKIVEGDDGCCAAAVLRSGFIGLLQLQCALDGDPCTAALGIKVTRIKKAETNTSIVQEAPGQLLRHYSPDIPTFFCLGDGADSDPSATHLPRSQLGSWVVIDLSGFFSSMQQEAAAYFDLGPSRSVQEVTAAPLESIGSRHVLPITRAQVAAELYKTLRAAEVVPGVKGIVVACHKFLRENELSAEGEALSEQSDLAFAIMDKVVPALVPLLSQSPHLSAAHAIRRYFAPPRARRFYLHNDIGLVRRFIIVITVVIAGTRASYSHFLRTCSHHL